MIFKKWYKNLDKKAKTQLIDNLTNLVMDLYIHIKCPKCKRKLPNEILFTKDGCMWCDIKYFRKNSYRRKRK